MISGEDDKLIDLAAMLEKRGHLDQESFPWKEEKMPIRLVAFPVDISPETHLTTTPQAPAAAQTSTTPIR